MMRAVLVLGVFAAALAGCASDPVHVLQYKANAKQADADGYYKYARYWFKGELKDNVPHGPGECRTLYLNASGSQVWLDGACEFNNGARVDALHAQRAEQAVVAANSARKDELASERQRRIEQQQWEAEERRREAASRRATEQALAGAMLQMQARVAAGAQQMAQVDRQVARNIADANAQNARRQAEVEEAARERQRQAQESARERQAAANLAMAQQAQGAERRQAEAAREKAREEAEQARAAKERADREAAAQRERDRAREQAEAQAKREKEKADREAARLAEARAKEDATRKYLSDLRDGARLAARKCPDGEGHYYVVGTLPQIRPAPVSCVGLRYRAQCKGGGVSIEGFGRHFSGLGSSCYMADTYKIEGKLSCPVEDVRVQALELTPGC